MSVSGEFQRARSQGQVGLTTEGFSIPIGAANRAEQQLEDGKFVAADETSNVVRGLEAVLSQHSPRGVTQKIRIDDIGGSKVAEAIGSVSGERPPRGIAPPQQDSEQQQHTQAPGRWRLGRNVVLVDDAVVTLAQLSNPERVQVQAEMARMGYPNFREEDDPRAIRAGDQGRSYRVHEVPDSDLRLWYRPLNEDHPDTLAVMGIQRKGERI
jgi:hypothetical protein